MFDHRGLIWLGLTPEPQRELPEAVAVLRARRSGTDPAALVDSERRRIEELVVTGTQRAWLRYLDDVADLVAEALGVVAAPKRDDHAALLAAEVVLEHHSMLIGLPGPAYARLAARRAQLVDAVRILRDRIHEGGGR